MPLRKPTIRSGDRLLTPITLPDKTLAVLDRVVPKGNRSQFISRAVLDFIESHGKETLRERLKHEAIANAGRDVEMAAEWFPLEQEAVTTAAVAKNSSRSHKTKIA
jgi:CopG family transcriptional regulator / antitoxin EndoAI